MSTSDHCGSGPGSVGALSKPVGRTGAALSPTDATDDPVAAADVGGLLTGGVDLSLPGQSMTASAATSKCSR